MHVYTQVNLENPLITAHKVNDAAQKVFAINTSRKVQSQKLDELVQILRRAYGSTGMGC